MDSHSQPAPFTDLLVQGATWCLALALAWTVIVLVCAGLEAATDHRLAWTRFTGCPRAWRTALVTVLIAALVGATPAGAVTSGPAGPDRPGPTAADGLPLPDRPLGGGSQPAQNRSATRSEMTVMVKPGDSLWRISQRRLTAGGPRGDAAVLAAVRQLYAANRSTIGPDPDLIRAGQQLAVPPPATPVVPEEDR